ncbi:MAG: hypothetical protein AMXMBFR83_15810 [Phycisphaerae bacterium]
MGDCGSNCGCKGELPGVSRRDLLKSGVAAAGALAAGAGISLGADGDIPPAAKVPAPKEWWDRLTQAGPAIAYSGENLKQIIFPLGGIGTGTLWLSGSGRLVNWQIFNNIQKNSLVDDTFFAVRIEREGQPPVIRALRSEAVGPFPGFPTVTFTGQYPIGVMRFSDPQIPAEVELEAFNPLVPLDEKSSGIPCAIFTVRVRNKTDALLRVSLLATCQNAVGHAGAGASEGVNHPTYGGNVNKPLREPGLTAVAMSSVPGSPASVSPPIELLVDHGDMPLLADAPVNGLSLVGVGSPSVNPTLKRVYWLSRGDLRLIGGALLTQIAQGVRERGDFLLISGLNNPLAEPLRASAAPGSKRRETVFASFDDGTFGKWTPRGRAFRGGPSTGTHANQQEVSGFLGAGLINTYNPNDDVRGTLTSPPFRIREEYISFLAGGGQWPGECCVNLKVDGKVVRTATGRNTEHLERVEWNVADFVDKEGEIEIVDSRTGPWGHVLADDIRFSSLPIDRITAEEADAWNSLLKEVKTAAPMTAVGVGKGRIMLVPVDLGVTRPGDTNRRQQRDKALTLIAGLAGVEYTPAVGVPEKAPSQGTLCLATAAGGASLLPAWTDPEDLHARFRTAGRLIPAGEPLPADAEPTSAGRTVNAALCVEAAAPPSGAAAADFVLAWHFPNHYYPQNAWRQTGNTAAEIGNMYANWYQDAVQVARQVLVDFERLRSATWAYRDAMFDTTLPQYFIDAVAANVSILRGPTCFWTRNDTFYGFEGCNYGGGGCCPMNCNHVWNYEQTLAKLWPALERNMRVTELDFHQMPNGGCRHRVEVPRDNPNKGQFPVADGQCGAVLKAYREHLQSADRRFLDDHWPKIKKAMDFAISEWDSDGDGIMDRPQFNTYDRVIYGQNTFISSLYLAALRAAEEMARLSRDDEAAGRYRGLFEKGSRKIAETLFDGEYYIQKADNINLGYGQGCLADQVVGQWWARILDLGDILPAEQVRSALTAVFKHNFLWTQEGFRGTQRFLQFADGKDKGLLICSWPKGGRPRDPILYRDEIWTGVEYQVAGHKLYEGQVAEALAIVCAARERYDGTKKSPWNEIECGDYYARALSSWSLLLAAQGYAYDGPRRRLAFRPRLTPENHRSLFTTAEGWGRFEQKREAGRLEAVLRFLGGHAELIELRFALPEQARNVTGQVRVNDTALTAKISAEAGDAVVVLNSPARPRAGETLTVALQWV